MPHNAQNRARIEQKWNFKIPLLFQAVKSKTSYIMERASLPSFSLSSIRGNYQNWRISRSPDLADFFHGVA